jgi:O-antigen ligase
MTRVQSALERPRLARPSWPDRLIEGGVVFLLIFTPLAYGTVEPWSEAVAVVVILAMASVWLMRMVARGELQVELPPGARPAALFLGLVLLQAVPLARGVVQLLSPWTAELHEAAAAYAGISTSWVPLSLDPNATAREALKLLAVALFFLVVYNTCRTRAQVRRALWTMVLMGALIAVLGIVQRATWNGRFYWIGPASPSASAFGPFVNRTHFAGLMVIVVPMALALLLAGQREPGRRRHHTSGWRERLRSWNSREGGPPRLVPWLILLMGGAALVSGSRGGVVALIAALIAMIGLSARARSRSRRVVTVVVAAALIILAGFWIGGDILLGTVERLAEEVGQPEESPRLHLWANALTLWRDVPLLGTGLASFGTVVPAVQTLPARVAFTHAESDWVQLLTDTGALGLLLALLAAGSLARALLSRYRETGSTWSRAIALGGLVALVGAAIQGIPNFNLAILSNWLYLGLAMAVATRGGEAAGVAWPEPAPLAPEPDAPSPPRTLAAGAGGAGIQAFRLLLRF